MTRNRQSAKAAGTRFETAIATYLAAELDDDRIERRRLTGAKDRGDIAGLRHHGQRLVLEVKDYGGQLQAGPWVEEAHTEAGNDGALCGVVIAKRRGTTDPGSQYVLCTVNDLIALLAGQRPDTDL